MLNINTLAKVAILLIALSASSVHAAFDVAKYCKLVKTGTKFPSFESCETYYVCNADGSYSTLNCLVGNSFDKESQSCKPASSVRCYYGSENPCAHTVGKTYVKDPKNCYGYIYCEDKKNVGTGTCPDRQIFNGKACDYGTCTNDMDGNTIVEVENLCEIMKSGDFFGDFEECNNWHKCVGGKKTSGHCEGKLVFDTKKGMCLANNGKMCSRIDNASVKPTDPCNAGTAGTKVADKNVCSVYYLCDGTTWNKVTCKDNAYFDITSTNCYPRQTARPAKGCNRCQYATTTWVNAVDSDCEEYLTCGSDGSRTANGTCGADNYFSELKQGCIQGSVGLDAYRDRNGACQKDPEQPSTVSTGTTSSTEAGGDASSSTAAPEGSSSSSSEAPASSSSSSSSAAPESSSSSSSSAAPESSSTSSAAPEDISSSSTAASKE